MSNLEPVFARYMAAWGSACLAASSALCMSAGLFWNLDWRAGRGVTFSFMQPGWPPVSPTDDFRKVFWYAVPFILVPAAVVL
jgi:hypothetical protein